MKAAALLSELQLGGVELKLEGGRLLCRSQQPGGVPESPAATQGGSIEERISVLLGTGVHRAALHEPDAPRGK
jgi:hypothetical protein